MRILARLHRTEEAAEPLKENVKHRLPAATVFAACAWSVRERGRADEYVLYRDKAIEQLTSTDELLIDELKSNLDLRVFNGDPVYREKVLMQVSCAEIAN